MAINKALGFSGGKDSLACLFLYEKEWSDINVLWVNTGKNYPEVLKTINWVKSLVPNFTEIKVDREKQNLENGIPAQVVPINFTKYGQEATGKKSPILIQSYLQCCGENIGFPLHNWCKANGITQLIRGQRLDDSHKSPARNGIIFDGIEYIQPIEYWTKPEVMNFLSEKMQLPEHLNFDHSSMDCYDCTAYTEHAKDRLDFTKLKYPIFYAEYKDRADKLKFAIEAEYGGY
jgi:phosphoadenosine phosphosulfate reductase